MSNNDVKPELSEATANPDIVSNIFNTPGNLLSALLNAIGMSGRDYTTSDPEQQMQIESVKLVSGGPFQSVYKMRSSNYHAQTLGKQNMQHVVKAVNQDNLTQSTHVEDWGWKSLISLVELWAWQHIASQATFETDMLEPLRYEHIRVDFPDGGVSCMHAYYPEPPLLMEQRGTMTIPEIRDQEYLEEKNTPVLILCPALTSNHNQYTPLIQHLVQQKKWSVVVTNRRGLCEPLVTPVFHLMGDDEDLHKMVLHAQEMPRLKNRPLYAIGVSVGGNWLLRYLGKYGKTQNKIIAAATISSPLNLDDLYFRSPVIAQNLLSNVHCRYLDPHQRIFQEGSPNIVRLYDDLRTAPSLTKFAYSHTQLFYLHQDLEANYANDESNIWTCYSSYDAARFAKNIQIPMLCIIAEDDPVIKTSPTNKDILLRNSNITRLVTTGGSHCMFRDDITQTNNSLNWAEGVVLGFFKSIEDSRIQKE